MHARVVILACHKISLPTESSSEEFTKEVITKQSSYTPIVLTIKDAQTICKKLESVKKDWFDLGLAFGLELSKLKDIEDQYLHNKRRLTEIVGKRLINDPDHLMTWPYICECLRSPTVERNDVAEEIEGKVPIIIILFNIACDHLGWVDLPLVI